MNAESVKKLSQAVQIALLQQWDPIGVRDIAEAVDEYDSYSPMITRMLLDNCREDEIFAYLWQLETEHMGLPGDRKNTASFAHQLMILRNSLILS